MARTGHGDSSDLRAPKVPAARSSSGRCSRLDAQGPDATLAWLLARENAAERQRLIAKTAETLSYGGDAQAFKLLSHLTPGAARDQALQEVMNRVASNNPEAAVAFVEELPVVEEMKLRERIVRSLADRDLAMALDYLKDHPINDPSSWVWPHLAGAMAKVRSPAEAIEWTNALPDEVARRRALPGVLSQLAEQNPPEAAREAAGVSDEQARIESLSRVATTWASQGPDQALAWAKELDGKDREAAMGAVLTQIGPHQPAAAAAQLNELITGVPTGSKPPEALVQAAGTIATAYFAENELTAANWAASLPEENARTAAVSSLAEEWIKYDPPGASEWIGTLPGGRTRDAAVGQLVKRIAFSDPSGAMAWADTVSDVGSRSILIEHTFTSWRRLDATAARTAIEATGWPEQEKTKWIEKVK